MSLQTQPTAPAGNHQMVPTIAIGMVGGLLQVAASPKLDRANLALQLAQALQSVLTTQTPNGADAMLGTDPGIQVPSADVQKQLLAPIG